METHLSKTVQLAREAGIDAWWDSGSDWRETFDEHLKAFEALVRADEREQGQKWFDAVTAQHKQMILAEREACAKLIESRKTGANELMDAVRDMEARAIRARSAGEPRTPADTAEIEEMAIDAHGIADAMLKAREA